MGLKLSSRVETNVSLPLVFSWIPYSLLRSGCWCWRNGNETTTSTTLWSFYTGRTGNDNQPASGRNPRNRINYIKHPLVVRVSIDLGPGKSRRVSPTNPGADTASGLAIVCHFDSADSGHHQADRFPREELTSKWSKLKQTSFKDLQFSTPPFWEEETNAANESSWNCSSQFHKRAYRCKVT